MMAMAETAEKFTNWLKHEILLFHSENKTSIFASHAMRIFTVILILFLTSFGPSLFAQSVTDSLVTEIPETVIILKDPRLDSLDKRPLLWVKAEEERTGRKEMQIFKPIVSADGKKKVTGSIYTKKGFRIVIYNGTDRAQALQAKNTFARNFPGTSSSMSYNVPSYKIKVGDFESRAQAANFLRQVGKSFPASFIVPDIITVKNINVIN